ncbi:DUF982 domain-containing protein [Phyllobacterium chamaecytisi]|uniref:DUF982 domain-containing protein n=1 Tax=Phyllobacterium chamaecytisi TaxID=2876082 RepID=UPI001CCD5F30|nr:DUF982 domain-containing protein [Phyllobacterium sp. KW56]MBZ9605805.1 DUF982 domain-containing protein [Phyllobacterium sp. KW56]
MFKPLRVRIPESATPIRIASLPEATEFILLKWPPHQSPILQDARQKCLDAVSGKLPVEIARTAFIVAAKEVGIYARRSRLKKIVAVIAPNLALAAEPTELV